jgi:hypothetical protein
MLPVFRVTWLPRRNSARPALDTCGLRCPFYTKTNLWLTEENASTLALKEPTNQHNQPGVTDQWLRQKQHHSAVLVSKGLQVLLDRLEMTENLVKMAMTAKTEMMDAMDRFWRVPYLTSRALFVRQDHPEIKAHPVKKDHAGRRDRLESPERTETREHQDSKAHLASKAHKDHRDHLARKDNLGVSSRSTDPLDLKANPDHRDRLAKKEFQARTAPTLAVCRDHRETTETLGHLEILDHRDLPDHRVLLASLARANIVHLLAPLLATNWLQAAAFWMANDKYEKKT